MDSRLLMKHFLILALLAVFALASVGSARGTYSYRSLHVSGHDDEHDTEPAKGDHGHGKGSGRSVHGLPMTEEEDQAFKKNGNCKDGCGKSGYGYGEISELRKNYGEDDDDEDDANDDHDDDEQNSRYEKPGDGDDDDDNDEDDDDKDDNDDDDDDGEQRGEYEKAFKDNADCNGGDCKSEKIAEFEWKRPKEDNLHGGYNNPRGSSGDDSSEDNEPHNPARYLADIIPVSISVEGMVSCQDCKYVGTDSLTNAKPLSGAKVKLVCRTSAKRRSFFFATTTTKSDGFFLISVPHFDFEKFTPFKDCMVFLMFMPPRQQCSKATNINNGKTGAPLRPIPTFAPSENLMYSVGPFAFAPQHCS